MVIRASRARRTDDPWFRMLLFTVGAVLGIGGILFDTDWLVTAGIVVLGVGMLVGIVSRRRQHSAEELDAEDTEGSEKDTE